MNEAITYKVLEIRPKDDTKKKPMAWLLVKRTETYQKTDDGSVIRARLVLSYRRLQQYCPGNDRLAGKEDGNFAGKYQQKSFGYAHSVKLTNGFVTLDLDQELYGQRIGTYLMNEIVAWAKQWPDADVEPIELLPGQAYGENKERRDRFYRQFNIRIKYTDAENTTGVSEPMLANELVTVETWKINITEYGLEQFLSNLLYENTMMSRDIELQNREIKGYLLKWERPINAAARILCQRYASKIVVWAILGLALAAIAGRIYVWLSCRMSPLMSFAPLILKAFDIFFGNADFDFVIDNVISGKNCHR